MKKSRIREETEQDLGGNIYKTLEKARFLFASEQLLVLKGVLILFFARGVTKLKKKAANK